nr:MAG TPA: protein of unknown function (DUF4969) [Caudoviricetes sp.]
MKKVAIVLMVIMSIAIFVGCGGSSDSDSAKTNKSVGEQCVDLIPDPNEYFKNATVSTNIHDDGCYYDIEGTISKDDFDSYVSACKKAGFTRIKTEENGGEIGLYYYYAYDEDKNYYLTVDFFEYQDGDEMEDTVYISCKENKEESSSSNE